MVSAGMLRLVINSDVRRSLMFILSEGPATVVELRNHLNVSSSNLIPRINELINEGLVVRDNGNFRLTFAGAVLAKNLRSLDALSGLLEANGQFFNEHDVSPIPENLQFRISELGACRLIENRMENITATFTEVIGRISKSENISIISPIFEPSYPGLVTSMAERKIPVSLIVTQNIFKILETEYADAINAYLEHDNARLYVVDDARVAFAVTDSFTTMSLYKNGSFDSSANLMSFEPSAVWWGQELFEHYRQKSREIRRR